MSDYISDLRDWMQARLDTLEARGYTSRDIETHVELERFYIRVSARCDGEYYAGSAWGETLDEVKARFIEEFNNTFLPRDERRERTLNEAIAKVAELADKCGKPDHVALADMLRKHLQNNLLASPALDDEIPY